VLLESPYREFFGPLLQHVRRLVDAHPRRYIAVVVPELLERRWYHLLLRSHRPTLLKWLLLIRGGPRVIVINTPWYLYDPDAEDETLSGAVETAAPEESAMKRSPDAAA
jgi:hypothetical protein